MRHFLHSPTLAQVIYTISWFNKIPIMMRIILAKRFHIYWLHHKSWLRIKLIRVMAVVHQYIDTVPSMYYFISLSPWHDTLIKVTLTSINKVFMADNSCFPTTPFMHAYIKLKIGKSQKHVYSNELKVSMTRT